MKRRFLIVSQRLRRADKVGRGALAVLGPVLLMVSSCSSSPPADPHDLCQIFAEKPGWWRASLASEKRWRIGVDVMMAVMYRESAYVHDARPPRGRLLWVVPWKRPSSAFGYAQATDPTWRDYQRDTGRHRADRDSFRDAIDFVGWYLARSHEELGISRTSAKHHYLAYHQGPAGYRTGSWSKVGWLVKAAESVEHRAGRYGAQLQSCRKSLRKRRGWFS